MPIVIQRIDFDSSAEALLAGSQLPTQDLSGSTDALLFGYASEGVLVGVVGLELRGSDALLRSLAVAEDKRRDGLGVALASYAEQQAAQHGVRTVYLLTTTAKVFFERCGYAPIQRREAPSGIASTSQFTELCPPSSTFMFKQLGI
ncbi:MAG: arsenic resistance N-acetyltransferase ArsN2 [Congregibacter sp.]